jgi:hypothetical protein
LFGVILQDPLRPNNNVVDISDRLCNAQPTTSVSPSPSPSSFVDVTPTPSTSPGFNDGVISICQEAFITSDLARACCASGDVNCEDYYDVSWELFCVSVVSVGLITGVGFCSRVCFMPL